MEQAGAVGDYKNLSLAAKMFHIVKRKKSVKTSEILSEAKVLAWNISEEDAKAAVKFLENIKLIKIVKEKKS